MLRPRFTGPFKRDRKRAGRRGKDLDKLDALMRLLAKEEPLEPRFRGHELSGSWKDFRECHIESDWLLIYLAPDLSDRGRGDHIRPHWYALGPL
jgi:mRNA interferase YafQ